MRSPDIERKGGGGGGLVWSGTQTQSDVWCCPPVAKGSTGEGDLLRDLADIGNGEGVQRDHQGPLLAAVQEDTVMVVAPLLGSKGDLDIQVQAGVEAALGGGGGGDTQTGGGRVTDPCDE